MVNLTSPCNFLQVLEHAQKTSLTGHAHRTFPENIKGTESQFSLRPDEVPTVGWMKASLVTTNALFQRIYKLLNLSFCMSCPKPPMGISSMGSFPVQSGGSLIIFPAL